jgi:hypothetical protein
VVVNATPRLLYPRERDPVPIIQEAGWVPGPVLIGAENLAPIGIRSPDCPARSESLYRLSYRGPRNTNVPSTILYLSLMKTKTVVCLSSDNSYAAHTISTSKSAPNLSLTPLQMFTVRLRHVPTAVDAAPLMCYYRQIGVVIAGTAVQGLLRLKWSTVTFTDGLTEHLFVTIQLSTCFDYVKLPWGCLQPALCI